jgi:hypothetical protein
VFTTKQTTLGSHHRTLAEASRTEGNDYSIASDWTELLSNAMWQICSFETFSTVQVLARAPLRGKSPAR